MAAAAHERFRTLLVQTGRRMGLTERAVDELARAAQIARWKKNQDIFGAEDPSDLVNFLVSGVVKVTCPAGQGMVCVQLVRPGQFFGLNWYPESNQPRLFGATAFTDCVVAIITSEMLNKVVAEAPPGSVLRILSYSWRVLSRLLYDKCSVLGLGLDERLRHELAILGRDFGRAGAEGVVIDIALTHADLAELCQGSRANVARAMKRFERDELLYKDARRLVLTRRFIAACPAPRLELPDATGPATATR